MNRIASLLLCLALMAPMGGCFRADVLTEVPPPTHGPSMNYWSHSALWGLVNLTGMINGKAVCPQGVARVQTTAGLAFYIASIFTAGFYAPLNVEVWCKGSAAADHIKVPVDAKQAAELLRQYPLLRAEVETELQRSLNLDPLHLARAGGF